MTTFNLEIDPKSVTTKIVDFIKENMEERCTSGLLVMFSGQIDSFTVTKLCIEAAGLESVKLVVTSDVPPSRKKEISSIAKKYLGIDGSDKVLMFNVDEALGLLIDSEGILTHKFDIIPEIYLRNMGKFLLQSHLLKEAMRDQTYDLIGKPKSEREKRIQEIVAKDKLKKRLKAALAYFFAERENLILINKTNKTEWLTGLFSKFGYGHAGDLMPIGDLYKTQVRQLAEYFEAPNEIKQLPGGEILPNVKNKYFYFFDLHVKDVDEILVRLQAGWSEVKISETLPTDIKRIEKVKHFYEMSKFQRKVPIRPKL